MYERFLHINKYVIFFILFGLLIFIGTLILIGSKREWFRPKLKLLMVLDDTYGLKGGTPVFISGIQAGTVTRVYLNDSNMISLEMNINKKFQNKIGKESKAIIKNQNLIGNKVIEITIDRSKGKRISNDSYIKSEVQQDIVSFLLKPEIFQIGGKNILNELQKITKDADSVAVEFSKAVEKSRITFEKMGEAATRVNQIALDLTKKEAVDNIKESIANIKKLLANLDATNSLTQNRIDSAFKDVSGILSKTDKLVSNMDLYSKNIPEILKQTNEILLELKTVVKAMEKHWLLKKYVKDLKENKK